MAISRPFLLALLGALLLGATLFAVQNARNTTSEDAAPAAEQATPEQQAAAPAEPAPAANPQDTLTSALNVGQVDSAAFDVTFAVRGGGDPGTVAVSGAFEAGAANDLPELEVNAKVTSRTDRGQGGFVAVDDEAYFTQGEKAWRVPEEVWGPFVEAAASGQGPSLQNLPVQFRPQGWVTDPKVEGTETLDGVETTHVSASIDAGRVLRDLDRSFPSVDLPNRAEVARAVKKAELNAWVGADDGILRRLAVVLAVVDDGERGAVALDVKLTGVNEPQDIEAPANVAPGRPGGELGELAETFVAGVSSADGSEPASLAALTTRNPQRAARAVKAGKKVVIFFHNPKGLDDQAMKRVVRAVDGRTKALVLTDHVDAVERYGKLVEDLGVAQTPAVVLIDSTGDARLIEGYVDTDTLAQAVADAR
jgi:hypothetical protein